MRSAYTPLLAVVPEGWLLIAVLLAAAAVAESAQASLLAVVLLLLVPLAARYCLDRGRHSPAKPLGVLAPVDGVICFRRECHDPYLGREAIRLSVAVAWWGNYNLRAPVEGEMESLPGSPSGASRIRTDEGEDLLVVLARGLMLGAPPVWVQLGERVGQGRRCGVRRLARVIDIYIPAQSRVEVQLGQTVRCGETVLATLLRRH